MSSEIAIPFRLSPDGKLAVETNPDRQVRQHVMSLVLTQPSERVMLPSYGIPLATLVFELDDRITQAHMLTLVTQAMATWEPGVEVLGIEPLDDDPIGNGLSMIKVNYQRREAANTPVAGRKVNTVFIGINGKAIEIVRG